MRVLIVGGVAGGASTAVRLRRLDEAAQIVVFERGKHISFANCGLPYYCGDIIKERDKLVILSPQDIRRMFNIDARVESEVLSIDRAAKTVMARDRASGHVYGEAYDKLVLSLGAAPLRPPIPGIEDGRIFTLRSLEDADRVKAYVEGVRRPGHAPHAVIVGGGFIGVEMAESLAHAGVQTSIVEMSNQLMGNLDYELACQVHNHVRAKGVGLHLNDAVTAFAGSERLGVHLKSGAQVEADLVILSVGVRPEVSLAQEAGLSIGTTGGIAVDEHMRTSDPDIYALGDAVEVKDAVTGLPTLVQLAGPANKQGRIVAENLCGRPTTYRATQATAIAKVFDLTVATTGTSEKSLVKNAIPYQKAYVHGFSHAAYYPMALPLNIKLLFASDGEILGAQAIGLKGVDKRIDVIATAMSLGGTVRDLIDVELAYAPPFGSAKDPVNVLGMVAENLLNGELRCVHWDEVDGLDGEAVIIDVRTPEERQIGFVSNSINIPLEELRSRIHEVPRGRPIVLYCAKGLNSYFAYRALVQGGFEDVASLSGGYSLYKEVKNSEGLLNAPNPITFALPSHAASPAVDDRRVDVEVDACGLSCPGPILKLSKAMGRLGEGEVLQLKTTDPAFKSDVHSWCKSARHTLIEIREEDNVISALIRKGTPVAARL